MRRIVFAILLLTVAPQGALAADAAAPLVPHVPQATLAIEISDFVRVPASDTRPSLARINYLYHAGDGSGRLFVNDMRGKIYVIRDGVILDIPFLDVAAVRAPYFFAGDGDNDERGVVTFAFHPGFARKGTLGYGKVYTIHSERGGLEGNERTPLFRGPKDPPDHYQIVCEWTVDSKYPNRINPASRREILRLTAPARDHGGGQLGFDPNLTRGRDPDYGLLYISVGDGGNTVGSTGTVEAYGQAQDMSSAFGKILRINPTSTVSLSYAVPGTNPFVNRKGILPEIWASGLRNPERFSWDRGGSRKMLIADIGQASVEEINLGQAGANYGWSTYEGEFLVDHQNQRHLTPLPSGKTPEGFTFPVATYGHSDGQAITGGFVYRGKLMPRIVGKYIFGDLSNGTLFYADAQSLEAGRKTDMFKFRLFYRGVETTMPGIVGNDYPNLRLGMGEDGEIYVLTKHDGMIRKISQHRG